MVVFRDYGGKDLARKLMGSNMYDALPSFIQSKPVEYGYSQLPYVKYI